MTKEVNLLPSQIAHFQVSFHFRRPQSYSAGEGHAGHEPHISHNFTFALHMASAAPASQSKVPSVALGEPMNAAPQTLHSAGWQVHAIRLLTLLPPIPA